MARWDHEEDESKTLCRHKDDGHVGMEFSPPFGGIWSWHAQTQSHEGAPAALEAARRAVLHRSWVKTKLMFFKFRDGNMKVQSGSFLVRQHILPID